MEENLLQERQATKTYYDVEQLQQMEKEKQNKKQESKWVFKLEPGDNTPQAQQPKLISIQNNKTNESQNQSQKNNLSKFEKVFARNQRHGLGLSEFQSSSTLQHSVQEVTFSKASRFSMKTDLITNYNYEIPSMFGRSKGNAGVSLGYGEKNLQPEYVIRNAKQNPGPDAYFHQPKEQFKNTKGSWPQSTRFSEINKFILSSPGPNYYNLSQNNTTYKTGFSFGLKPKPLQTFQEIVPSPFAYNQSIKPIASSRYATGAHIGYGKKIEFASKELIPGPGQYEVQSVFSKNAKNMMMKNSGKLTKN